VLRWPPRGGPTSPLRRTIVAAAFLSFITATSGADTTTSFLRDATVVVLIGLPGDVEHETAYAGDLQRLLSVLAQDPARPRSLHVLVDAPQQVALPPGLKARVQAGTRQNLLALASELAGGTQPLVVLVWGHGGEQGSTPVFHVRGPRVTADDLAAFAARAGTRPSRWILSFRGSGQFARALQASGRDVLASEDDVSFRSDPIGFPLLVGLLTERPALTFSDLATALAEATHDWYARQHLARTEEPTLWTDGGAGRRLVTAEPTLAEAKPPGARQIVPPSAWSAVTPVTPESQKDKDAVVLFRSTRYTIGDSPALRQEVDEFVQVLTTEGEARGDVDISYSPPEERVTILDAEIRHPDGRVERLDVQGAREAPPEVLGPYRTPARKVFSFPGVRPGAIVRLHRVSEWKTFPLPNVILEVPLDDVLPVLASEIAVQADTRSPLHYAVSGLAVPPPLREKGTYGETLTWRFAATAARPRESLVAPVGAARLLVSTFTDWPAFVSWYRRLVQEADRVTPEIEAKAKEVTRGASSDLEKVRALYDYVASLRYVAIPMGVNSHRPHAAARVLENRYGDCKDKANLFNTLLRTQGITADLVLVPRFTQADDAVPGVGFNHAISRVRLGNEVLWADTTDEVARFGLLPPGDPGRKVLVVDGVATGLVDLPAPDPSAHRLAVDTRVEADGAVHLQATASGIVDYALRQSTRASASEAATRPVLGELFRTTAGTLALSHQRHTATAALGSEFTWEADGRFPGLTETLGDGVRLARAPFWLPAEWDLAGHARHSLLFLNQGYPLVLHQEVEISVPTDADVTLPVARNEADGPLRFHTGWTRPSPGVLRATLEVEMRRGEMDAADTAAFPAQLERLRAAANSGALYKTGGR
jgi:transglutaminase-like putative cysteine protease